ncbi:sodium:solute symporter family transporter [Congregibacter sp.]|uniref:sodium:solute symporter family transporter n=1 Tax=Congregibacter sp. TaxID=2744308 RepID=UPI003F6B71D3
MTALDWWVIGAYLLAMLALAAWLGRSQYSEREYYLGGGLPAPALATSILATQCSTNSLLGAPAFVGFAAGGGMLWLQYELAVPLAMLGLAFLFPAVHRSGVISIYAFLEQRIGRAARLTASASFLFFRGIATGVTVYGVASVLSLITGIGYIPAVAMLMGATISYDVMGGMRAVVVSDVLQMLLLIAAVVVSLIWLAPDLWEQADALAQRSHPLVNDWGLSGETNFGFWPMLFGGLFLYMAYYGCDQSQAQRLLAASNERDLNKILVFNGLLRFPLVLAYCLLGLGLAAYALQRPEFIAELPVTASGAPNLNMVFPAFVLREFAPGLAGLAIVGLFAAAMSSIDSALNSLSASTLEDFMPANGPNTERRRFLQSKIVTLCWGVFAVGFSFSVEHIASTLLESINKVSSLINGPLLGLFIVAILLPGTRSSAAVVAFAVGIALNLALWKLMPEVSWLWWNLTGCIATLGLTALSVGAGKASDTVNAAIRSVNVPAGTYRSLLGGFFAMLALLVIAQLYL